MSRSTTAYVSATKRERVHDLEFYAGETTPVAADFTAILGAAAALSSALWEIVDPSVAVMSSAVIDGNTSEITLACQAPGETIMRCTGGTDAGVRIVQMYRLRVNAAASLSNTTTTGPQSLEATAVVVGTDTGGGGIVDGGGA